MSSSTRVTPSLAPGVTLLSEYQGSGFTEPHYLIGRADQQIMHVSRLLFLVASHIDGLSSHEEIAARVTQEYGRVLTVEGVELLLDKKLAPMGLVAVDGGALDAFVAGPDSPVIPRRQPPGRPTQTVDAARKGGRADDGGDRKPELPRANPLLALRLRGTLVPARLTNILARLLSPLFLAPVVLVVILALVVVDVRLATSADLANAFAKVVLDPGLLLSVIGIVLACTLFHELGHAAACRAGGARPGNIGVAVYVVYPAFFTDVTDSYRLGRAGRVRTDLGGVYFNALSILLLVAIYGGTSSPAVLLAIVLVHIEMFQQLIPLGRLDGYFVLADLAGVPDLFSRIGPIFRSVLPGRPMHPKVAELRRSARVVVTVWVMICVPMMAAILGLLLWSTPTMTRQITEGMVRQWESLQSAVPGGDWAAAALAALSLLLLPLPLIGLAWLVVSTLRQLATAVVRTIRRHQDRTPRAMLPAPPARPPHRGVRRALYAVTRGTVNLGPGPAERQERELRVRVRTRFAGTRRVIVLSSAGGAGKTTTTLMLGHTFATHRLDRAVALDADEHAGNLARRLPRETGNSLSDLLADRAWLERYSQIRSYTSQDPDTGLEVLAADDNDHQLSRELGGNDCHDLVDTLDRHYNVILADTGTSFLDGAMRQLLDEADQLVLVVPPTVDGSQQAAQSLDWLDRHGYEMLVWNAVAVVNAVREPKSARLRGLEYHFRARCAAVVRVPWDKALQNRLPTALADLRPATRHAYLKLASTVADSFATSPRELYGMDREVRRVH